MTPIDWSAGVDGDFANGPVTHRLTMNADNEGSMNQFLRLGAASTKGGTKEVGTMDCNMKEEDRMAPGCLGKPRCDARGQRQGEPIVAYPVLEEVAEDVQRICRARLLLDERVERLVRLRPFLAQMEVGDEKATCHRPRWRTR